MAHVEGIKIYRFLYEYVHMKPSQTKIIVEAEIQ